MNWLKKNLLYILISVVGLLLATNIIIHYWNGWSVTVVDTTIINNLITPFATIASIVIYWITLKQLMKQNQISQTVLKIAMHDYKQKLKPELEAYYRINHLSINQPDDNLITFLIKNKSLGKARIQSINSSGYIIVKPYDSEVELELNQECYLECSIKSQVFQRVVSETNQYCNGNFDLDREREFQRRICGELNQSKLHIGFSDELGHKYYVSLSVDRSKMGTRYFSDLVFTGEPISNSH